MNEQVVRKVTLIGNGAHVFVPKEWVGESIFLVRPAKNLKEKILSVLSPYLDNILGVYLYGSYARDEQQEDSDIDLFVVTDKPLKIKEKQYEIICIEKTQIKKVVKHFPVLLHSIISEAKVIINGDLLSELRKMFKPKISDFKEYFSGTKSMIEINRSIPSEYSLILRLRGVFIIKQILQGKKYSRKEFERWIRSNLSDINYPLIYGNYERVKHNFKIEKESKIKDLNSLIEFLNHEIKRLA